MTNRKLLAGAAFIAACAAAPAAFAQAQDMYLGQLMQVGFTFCPKGWTDANGQLLAISANSALFSLYGTTYGGDGRTTFALPDLRGRVSMHTGTGPGLPPVVQGEVLGTPTTTLLVSNLPAHNHMLNGSSSAPNSQSPGDALLATFSGTNVYTASGSPGQIMKPTAIGMTGGGLPFDQHQPSLVLRWCVALQGVFPSRN